MRPRTPHLTQIAVSVVGRTSQLALLQLLLAAAVTIQSTGRSHAETPCPSGAITVEPGASIQAAVDHAGNGATFCLKSGIHRMQAIRPRPGQSFYGEDQTVLNGSSLLTSFSREGRYWVATWRPVRVRQRGDCAKTAPGCDLPENVFFNDRPLVQVLKKEDLDSGRYYLDRPNDKIYFIDDPTGLKVEMAVMAYAFESTAPNVLITNVIIEKYATSPQKGAIQAEQARRDCGRRTAGIHESEIGVDVVQFHEAGKDRHVRNENRRTGRSRGVRAVEHALITAGHIACASSVG